MDREKLTEKEEVLVLGELVAILSESYHIKIKNNIIVCKKEQLIALTSLEIGEKVLTQGLIKDLSYRTIHVQVNHKILNLEENDIHNKKTVSFDKKQFKKSA